MGTKDDRLSLRIPSVLKQQVKRYCAVHSIDMSELVTRFFSRLVAREAARIAAQTKKGT